MNNTIEINPEALSPEELDALHDLLGKAAEHHIRSMNTLPEDQVGHHIWAHKALIESMYQIERFQDKI